MTKAAACTLPPSIVVESSPGKRHLYWLTSPGAFELSEYTPFIESLAAITGADDNAKDLARCCASPGFDHCKGERHRVTMLNDNAFLIYGKQDIADAFEIDLSVIGTKTKAKTKRRPIVQPSATHTPPRGWITIRSTTPSTSATQSYCAMP